MRCLVWLPLLSLLAPISRAAEPTRVAVMEFVTKGGVTPEQADALCDLVANTIRERDGYNVIAKADIAAMLGFEKTKDSLGCDDLSCLTELGGALGVELIVGGNISLFGDDFLLNLRVIDPDKAEVVAGTSKTISGGQSGLLNAVPVAVRRLFDVVEGKAPMAMVEMAELPTPPAEPAPPVAPVVTAQATPPREGSDGLRVAAWVTLGLAIAAAGSSAACGGLALADQADMESEFKGSERWQDLRESGETLGGTSWGLLGAGVALAVVSTVLFVVSGDDAATTTAGIVPVEGGVVAAVGVRSW